MSCKSQTETGICGVRHPTKTQNVGRSILRVYHLYRQVTAVTGGETNSEGREKAFPASERKSGRSPRRVNQQEQMKQNQARLRSTHTGKCSCRWSLGASDSRAAAKAQAPPLAASSCSSLWAWHHVSPVLRAPPCPP